MKNQFEPHSCGCALARSVDRTHDSDNAPPPGRSCWAFSAISGIEARFALDGHKVESFSAQNLVCFTPPSAAPRPLRLIVHLAQVDCTLGGIDTCSQGGEMHDGVLQVAALLMRF